MAIYVNNRCFLPTCHLIHIFMFNFDAQNAKSSQAVNAQAVVIYLTLYFSQGVCLYLFLITFAYYGGLGVFGLRFSGCGVWCLWCGAFWGFWGRGSLYKHRRINLEKERRNTKKFRSSIANSNNFSTIFSVVKKQCIVGQLENQNRFISPPEWFSQGISLTN